MESSNKQVVRELLEENQKVVEDQVGKVIEWEDYEQELVRLCSLTTAFEEAKGKKLMLEEKLSSLIQLEEESLNQSNEIEQMSQKLEYRKLVMGNMSMHSKICREKLRKQEEQLSAKIRSILVGGSALSVAKRIQDSGKSLAGEKGYVQLRNLQKLLRERQQYMVSQVYLIYPVKSLLGKAPEQELESFSSKHKSVVPSGPMEQGMLTISGLQLTGIPLTKLNIFSDKKETQRSSTALGYVAHAVSLIASYLQVPLRYSLRIGCSHSYICDYAPSIELSTSYPKNRDSSKLVEFPLFSEGQESTRTAYAVFLLNKDLEQLLNFIGVKSVGPRHVLENFKELLMTILDPEYRDT